MEDISIDNQEKELEPKTRFKNNFFRSRSFFRIIGVLFFLGFFYFLFFSAPDDFPNGVILTIEKGESLRSVSSDLKEKNMIRSRVFFEAFVVIYGGEKHISEGDYLFENSLPVFEVARRIAEKDRHLASIKVTIPEGFNNSQIAETLSRKLKNFNEELFLREAIEGYLFPDTYFFFSTDTENEVIKYLGDNFKRRTEPFQKYFVSSPEGEKAIIIMASIIEREAKGEADRDYISGILWKRLEKGMPLQVDAAPMTYKKKGLPERPICNPGLAAIKASLFPKDSPYLYYLHDENGGIHFARTFSEHKINKTKYLKN